MRFPRGKFPERFPSQRTSQDTRDQNPSQSGFRPRALRCRFFPLRTLSKKNLQKRRVLVLFLVVRKKIATELLERVERIFISFKILKISADFAVERKQKLFLALEIMVEKPLADFRLGSDPLNARPRRISAERKAFSPLV